MQLPNLIGEELDAMIAHAAGLDALIAEMQSEVEGDCVSAADLKEALREIQRIPGVHGRSRRTKAREMAVIGLYELAVSQKGVAEAVGISREALRLWERADDAFAWQLTRARARGALRLHIRALAGGRGSFVARWLLERRFPEDYGRVGDKRAVGCRGAC